ncbi:hypothetical protein VTK73DRAFT_9805 [Phialemonium thermophilum]|uniref:Uncharacterized protein n=1 Tax=Phialemonium thermophilum TaxID=223376 RepID=A0ABR3W098_9PEZI
MSMARRYLLTVSFSRRNVLLLGSREACRWRPMGPLLLAVASIAITLLSVQKSLRPLFCNICHLKPTACYHKDTSQGSPICFG